MVTVQDVLKSYSQLSAEDLDYEFPSTSFIGTEEVKGNQVLIFAVANPNTMVDILTIGLGNSRLDDKCVYHFSDGSKAKYVKCRDCYEFTRYGKTFARLTWRR